jgi:ATP adenylyltransferase
MQKLWSPWRSNYIESFKKKKEDNICVFCQAQQEDIENDDCLVVYRATKCFVTLNLYPYNSGHIMVIPKRHTSQFCSITAEEMKEIMDVVQISMKALDIAMKPQGYNFGANLGKAAGAGIDEHIHFHILPRWNGDTNFMPTLGEVKVISQDLLVTKKNLLTAFKEALKQS